MGLYIQGTLIDSDTAAFREHPEWALQTAEGKPFFSGFRDNPLGEMHYFNILSPYQEHVLGRIKAVCETYGPAWIYLDGGSMLGDRDWRLRRPVLPDSVDGVPPPAAGGDAGHGRASGALLLNAQNIRTATCTGWSAGTSGRPRRGGIRWGSATTREINHEPDRTMLPLYWQDEPRYLAMCVAFGFTPTACRGFRRAGTSAHRSGARSTRRVDAAGAAGAEAGRSTPDCLTQDSDVVAFAEQLPG